MSVVDLIKEQVDRIAADRGMADHRAFGYWFLEEIEDLSPEEAEECVVDGPWDGGRDAVYFDEENEILNLYQFKYSETVSYVLDGFAEIQRAVQAEATNVSRAREVRVIVVSLASADASVNDRQKVTQRNLRAWLTRNHRGTGGAVEVFDRRKFAQLFERLYGLDLTLSFAGEPIRHQDAVLGLLDASGLKEHAGSDELFAFNIRKFLGLKKGSVNEQIKASLDDAQDRNRFWKLNNGIVCLVRPSSQLMQLTCTLRTSPSSMERRRSVLPRSTSRTMHWTPIRRGWWRK